MGCVVVPFNVRRARSRDDALLRLQQMSLRKLSRLWLAVLVSCAVLVLLPVLWLFLPSVDESVGFLTGRALRLVQNHTEQGHSVRDIILANYKNVRWRTYHRDYISETYVRCDAVDRNGSSVAFVWVVMTIPERRGLAFHVHTIATAHTKSAFNLAPSLFEPGHTLYDSPDYANW